MHVSASVKLACPRVNEPYAHQSRACDSRNYRRVIVEIITQPSIYGVIVYFLLCHESLNYSTGQ